jgi:hypothetical protein
MTGSVWESGECNCIYLLNSWRTSDNEEHNGVDLIRGRRNLENLPQPVALRNGGVTANGVVLVGHPHD